MTNPALLALLIDALAKTTPADPDQGAHAVGGMAAHRCDGGPRWRPVQSPDTSPATNSFARAAKPGVNDEKAVRLRINAIAAGRMFDPQLQAFRRQRQPAAARPLAVKFAAAMRARHRTDPPLPVPGRPMR